MNCKKNANSNPGEERQLFHPESEKVVEIGLERLRPFKNHPFKVKEDEAMAQLMESIERYGILNPLIVMPTREGVYQIVSGHRRKYCAEKLGYTQVPVIIRYMKECGIGYGSVNHPVDRDPVCGYNGIIGDICPKCGRRHRFTESETIDRIDSEDSWDPDEDAE